MATMLIDQSRGWQIWAMPDIWTGPQGAGRIVPNPNDLIYEPSTDRMNKVTDVNYTNGISEWRPVQFTLIQGFEDVFTGVGPGTPSEAWRINVSYTHVPYEATFDTRLTINGNDAHHVRVYKNTNYEAQGSLISAMLDQNNHVIDSNVPVLGTGTSRTLPKFWLTEVLPHGTPLYVVVYNDAGTAISEYRMVLRVMDYIPDGMAPLRYITGISLNSRFLDSTEPNVVNVPINLPMSSMLLTGTVFYSNGDTMTYPVDGVKFSLLNVQPLLAGVVDQKINFRLRYNLGSDENGDQVHETNNARFITKPYQIRVQDVDSAFHVKLMCFPTWNVANQKYDIVSYLYTVERDEAWDVTSLMQFGVTGHAWSGNPDNQVHDYVVTVNLDQVNPRFSEFRYVQNIRVGLLSGGTSGNLRWKVNNSYRENDDWDDEYYEARIASVAKQNQNNQYTINCTAGFGTAEEWMEGLYRSQHPLQDTDIENTAPDPTHFRILYKGNSVQKELNDWNADNVLASTDEINTGNTIVLEFIRIDAGQTLVLGACGLSVTRSI